jgi:hypothetical protein
MDTEVYSWRVSTQLKSALERTARERKTTVAEALRQASAEWIGQHQPANDEEMEQRRLHMAAERFIGSLNGLAPSTNAAKLVKQKLRRQHDR